MATLVLTITHNSVDAADYAVSGDSARNLENCAKLLQGLAAGAKVGSVDVQRSASDPVRASSFVTLTYASISNNDTMVIGATTLTCVTGTPSGFTQWKKETDATVTATNLVAAITGNTTLNKQVTATSAAGVVTIVSRVPGPIGNCIKLTGSTGIVADAAYLEDGAGGAESTQVVNGR